MAADRGSYNWIGWLAAAAAVYAFDWNFLQGGLGSPHKITDYTLYCERPAGSTCSSDWRKNQRNDFTIYPSEQVVVSQIEGEAPRKLAKCAVVDRKNWRCNFSNSTMQIGFTSGEFWSGIEAGDGLPPSKFEVPNNIKHVWRVQYLLAGGKK